MIAFGLGTLRLAPAAFWALSLPELAHLMPPSHAAAPSRTSLAALIAAHPDTET